MNPTVTITKGERTVTIELTNEQAGAIAEFLKDSRDTLKDSETGMPYPACQKLSGKIFELEQNLQRDNKN